MNFPTQLTAEEKELKEMFEKLKRVRKAIELATKGSTGSTANTIVKSETKTAKNSLHAAEVATEEVKKKIISGMITVKKVDAKQTFKRSKNLPKKQSTIGSIEGDLDTEGTSIEPGEIKPIPKLMPNLPNMNVRGPTLYIRSYDLQNEPLNSAFEKFGTIKRLFVEDRRRSAFLTFDSVEVAEKAMKEMDGAMINGMSIRVSFARRQNQENFEQQRRFNRTSISLESDSDLSPTKNLSDSLFSPLSSPQKSTPLPEFSRGGGLRGRGRGRGGGGRGRGFDNSNRGGRNNPSNMRNPQTRPQNETQPPRADHTQVANPNFSQPGQRVHLRAEESNDHDDGSGRQLVTYDDDDSLFS